MKALSKTRIKQIKERESREAAERREAMLNAMPPEERKAFLDNEAKKAREALTTLAIASSFISHAYS